MAEWDGARRAICVITSDPIGARLAGPAIRSLNIAAALAVEHDVMLISTASCDLQRADFECRHADLAGLQAAVGETGVVIVHGLITHHTPWLLASDKILVVDLYDPVQFEQLEQLADLDETDRRTTLDFTTRVLNEQLARGDFFICASERQRYLWLGQLAAMGRINPDNYDRDSRLLALIAVCPFGIEAQPPQRTGPGLRTGVCGIGPEDRVLLWAGGVYNWFDPLTLVRAVDVVRRSHDDVRLFFVGMQHPNPHVPAMQVANDTRELSAELGLTDRYVFFNEGWVPYEERGNFLLDADAGVSTHRDHIETTFSFRTRILDYLWAGLPIISTGGDYFGDLVAELELGVRVPEGDVDAVAAAITRVLYDREFADAARAEVARIRADFRWDVTLAPLVAFCRDARRAADAGRDRPRFARHPVPPANTVAGRLQRVVAVLREGGLTLLVRRVAMRLSRR